MTTDVVTDVTTGVVSSVLSKLIMETGRQIGYFINYNDNIKKLKEQAEELKRNLDGVQLSVETARGNGDRILPEINWWLGSVDKLWKKATIFLEQEVKDNKGCLYGWCPNVKAWYSLSKRAQKMTQEVTKLQNKGDWSLKKISEPARPKGIEFTSSTRKFWSFQSRERITQELKDTVKGGDFHMIGICGLGGVGKTTLIKEVGKWAREEKLFDEIVMAVASRNSDLFKIQDELADKLGLKFTETSLSGRADRLWDRLLTGSRGCLIVLDDVWECINLKSIGIPIGDDNKKNIIVLTSRSKEVCEEMECDKIIEVEVLPKQEAWMLFREMAGDTTVDAPDFYVTASKVAKECGGLPIAIVTVGSALKGKKVEVWDDALLMLSQSIMPTNLPGVEEKLFHSLQLSYDHLNCKDKEAGLIFLICCLYREGANIQLEELVRYGMGMTLFKGIKLVMQARNRLHALAEKLQSCYLLLDGEKPHTVKMHDVVRDVGIWIASKTDQFKMITVNDGRWPDADYEHCNAISVISEITELPLGGLNCPKLSILDMSCNSLSDEILVANMFEGMTKLTVVRMFSTTISSLPSSLRLLTNLRVLNLEYCLSLKDLCSIPKELVNLEILSLRGCDSIKKLPREIGERLTKLRVLDMRGCHVKSILPGAISSMRQLEELCTEIWLWDEEGNASLNELDELRNLTFLMTGIRHPKFLPKDPVFEKLERYYIKLDGKHYFDDYDFGEYPFVEKALLLYLDDINEVPIGYCGISKLLKESAERVFLKGYGLVIALDELARGGFRHLKELRIGDCDNKVEYLANYSSMAVEWVNIPNSSFDVFTKLETLDLHTMSHLKAIVSCFHDGKPPKGSFGNLKAISLNQLPELTHLWKYSPTIHSHASAIKLSRLQCVRLNDCKSLKYVFTLLEATSLEHLKTLEIKDCKMMEAVILENLRPSSSATTIGGGVEVEPSNNNVIEFPKLKELILHNLDSLTCFGSVIEFPELKDLTLGNLGKHAYLQSIFNHKAMFPSLETLTLSGMPSKELWGNQYPPGFFRKLKFLTVTRFRNIVNIIPSNLAQYFSALNNLQVKFCDQLEEVFESKGVNIGGADHVILFKNLSVIQVWGCSRLKNLFSSSVARNLLKLKYLWIYNCESMEEVIAKEEGVEEDGRKDETIFPELQTLRLAYLPRLKRFCPVNSTLKLPALDGLQIDIHCCPKLTDFRRKARRNAKMQ